MRLVLLGIVVLTICVGLCIGDLYLHNPRGSNDRLNEQTENRDNDNRMFNSQNNDKGGYCYGPPLSYYAGSQLSIEWTAQHACGEGGNTRCNFVLQYMCGYNNGPTDIRIRDGTTTNTPQDDPTAFNQPAANNPNDYATGMHESYSYYQDCKNRQRNSGLFTSDQNVQNNIGARSTRQNPGGTQHGFECPEERDYYPYWAPTPWKDIAVLTADDSKMCSYYQSESQNVKSKEYCSGNSAITQQACEAGGGKWLSSPAWGIAKPDCEAEPYSRDNHLGNGFNGYTNSYNWTLPTADTEKCILGDACLCVLRMRYNITTAEIDGYGDDDGTFDDSSLNKDPPIDTDPTVVVSGLNLTLAVNTNQYGRTFQDRSYVFSIKPRPSNVPASANIINLNVRGKRGNIVQAYPATEYDFVPQHLQLTVGDYVHYQWTGCDTNPNNYEGEGTDGTDRSNLVQMASPTNNQPLTDTALASDKTITPLFEDPNQRSLMAHLGQTGCKTYAQLLADNNNNQNNVEQDKGNCMKLNAASPYFNGGLVRMNSTGTFYYMSTRNNNFSNRTQKGTMVVNPVLAAWAIALIVIGVFAFVSIVAVGGLVIYAKKRPHSAVAEKLDWLKSKVSRRRRSL